MSFYRDGLLKGAEEDSDEAGGGEEEDEDLSLGKSGSRSGAGKPNGTGKPPASLTWYFKCVSSGQRDELIAKIYMNALNRWKTHGYNSLADG